MLIKYGIHNFLLIFCLNLDMEINIEKEYLNKNSVILNQN